MDCSFLLKEMRNTAYDLKSGKFLVIGSLDIPDSGFSSFETRINKFAYIESKIDNFAKDPACALLVGFGFGMGLAESHHTT